MSKELIKELKETYKSLYHNQKEDFELQVDFRYITMKIIENLLNRVEQLERKIEGLK